MATTQTPEADLDLGTNDLGPLAWVLDELRKSLEAASGALKRFVREAEQARGSEMTALDSGQLRIAKQQVHQAVGALEMVGMSPPAIVLRAMEGAIQRFVDRPETCREAPAGKVERAGFALLEYLDGLLHGKKHSAVALFPQYRDAQEIAGADRVHPADLWAYEWRWQDPEVALDRPPLQYEPAVRARMDQAVLKVVKSADPEAARSMVDVTLGLAAGQTARQPRTFWKIAAAYFEAVALGLLPGDVYVKRSASRVLLQYAQLAKGELGVSDRLVLDLLFFCAQAVPPTASQAPVLAAIRSGCGLDRFAPVDYEARVFGRFDPVVLAQARKRIGSAKESWSSLAGGDANKLRTVVEQFSLVSDSLVKLLPASTPLAQALTRAAEGTAKTGKPPSAELAMEVATAVLYLEASFEDLDPSDAQLAARTERLAQRLEQVRSGGKPEPLEPWIEELYRRVSDRQTMGSVVGELHGTMGELEKVLDQFFRNPHEKGGLRNAPTHLMQMRGVLSVLGLDHASQAVARMRESVEQILVTDVDEEKARAAGTFEKLGNNLGALGFLIDMLNYQPALAKKLFVFDAQAGELKPLMGRAAGAPQPAAAPSAPAAATGGIDFLATTVTTAAPAPTPAAPPAIEPTIAFEIPTSSPAAEPTVALHVPAPASEPTIAMRVPAPEAEPTIALQVPTPGSEPTIAMRVPEPPSEPTIAMRVPVPEPEPTVALHPPATPTPTPAPAPVAVAPAAAPAASLSEEEEELRGIFLEEAREVMQTGLGAIDELRSQPADVGTQTTLRRAFHTLKGSSRMVGLNEFGEAAWAMEQMHNAWLAEQKPASDELLTLSDQALRTFGRWVDDIAAHSDAAWKAAPFQASAEALRMEGRLLPLAAQEAAAAPLASVTEPAASDQHLAFEDGGEPSPQEIEAMAVSQPAALPEMEVPELHSMPPEALPVSEAAPAAAPFTEEAPSSELAADFDFTPEAPASDAPIGLDRDPVADVPPVVPPEIAGIDFGSLAAISSVPAAHDESPPEPPAPPAESVAEPEPPVSAEEQVRVIGDLRIGIPLYNVYLNEADEWSRRLATELSEWAVELNGPVSESTVALAHSLAGSSATVGFRPLSTLARSLEHALLDAQAHSRGTAAHAQVFNEAAGDIRRLLHQFAAGFLKEPSPEVLAQLDALRAEPVPSTEETAPAATEPPAARPPVAAQAVRPAEIQAAVAALATPHPRTSQRAQADIGDADEDIDVADALDPDLFSVFEEEAAELMPQLGGALRQWAARPDNTGARAEALRVLHTIKGSARLAGALRLGERAHRMESAIEQLGSENVEASQIEPLLQRFDTLQANLETVARSGAPAQDAGAEAASPVDEPLGGAPEAPGAGNVLPPLGAEALRASVTMSMPSQTAVQRGPGQAVRVRSQLLDRLVNQAGEVMITRSRLEAELSQLRGSLNDLTGNLDRLRGQLRDIEVQAESQMQSRMAQTKETAQGFDPLEFDRFTRVQELTRMMAESVNDVATVQRNIQRTVEATEDDLIAQARQTRELQRDLLRTRMVEFEGISDRLYRVVRQAAKDTGKQVKLDIEGGSMEMDRGVLDRMTPAFEHLLRNCVAHGIEAVAERQRWGKDATGSITIALKQEGNDVSVEFRDDGAGLNLARIREKAAAQGLIGRQDELSDADAANLVFTPGFSTASEVTGLAGRGIGMDVVRSEVNALGGRIETATQSGRGTSFRLVLPLTTAVTQVVMLRAGPSSVGVPANLVEIVRRVPAADVERAYETGNFEMAGESLPFFWAGALLQSSPRSAEQQGRTLPVMIFRSAAQRVAVHVDEVLGNQEVVVKNLGPQLSRLPGLAGMSVLASGAVVLIYNPVALATVFGEQARRYAQPAVEASSAVPAGPQRAQPAGPQQVPLVLVVDDSITVRRVTQRLLQREGYRVTMAADGLQALERLAEEKPAIVLSDIEMPRMDGFDLARNIRADARLADLPIVMITSRIAEKHRDHALELGVNHYLGKPYSEEELLSLVRRYSGVREEPQPA